MRDCILLRSVCTFSLPNGLCFQDERPGQEQGVYQPPTQAQHQDPSLYPELPAFSGDEDAQAKNMAHEPGAAGPLAAAVGNFLSSPNF